VKARTLNEYPQPAEVETLVPGLQKRAAERVRVGSGKQKSPWAQHAIRFGHSLLGAPVHGQVLEHITTVHEIKHFVAIRQVNDRCTTQLSVAAGATVRNCLRSQFHPENCLPIAKRAQPLKSDARPATRIENDSRPRPDTAAHECTLNLPHAERPPMPRFDTVELIVVLG
jgi:hypothetical protein